MHFTFLVMVYYVGYIISEDAGLGSGEGRWSDHLQSDHFIAYDKRCHQGHSILTRKDTQWISITWIIQYFGRLA